MHAKRIALVAAWPPPAPDGAQTVLCPCLDGLPHPHAPLLSILPVHDANAMLAATLSSPEFRRAETRPDYAALCLVDPFRRLDDLFDAVAEAGIGGVINLPSVSSFFDPSMADAGAFDAGFAREVAGLARARERGLSVAGIAPDAAHAARLGAIGCAFVLAPDGHTMLSP